MLIVISGLPGTGKTTLGAALAQRVCATHLSVDAVEDALLGVGLEHGWTTAVAAYEAVRAAGEQNLRLGGTVVVDAVNDSEAARQTWRRAAASTGVPVVFVLLQPPPPAEHRARLTGRRRDLRLVSEPTWEEVVERGRTYEPWSGDVIQLSATEPVDALVDKLLVAASPPPLGQIPRT